LAKKKPVREESESVVRLRFALPRRSVDQSRPFPNRLPTDDLKWPDFRRVLASKIPDYWNGRLERGNLVVSVEGEAALYLAGNFTSEEVNALAYSVSALWFEHYDTKLQLSIGGRAFSPRGPRPGLQEVETELLWNSARQYNDLLVRAKNTNESIRELELTNAAIAEWRRGGYLKDIEAKIQEYAVSLGLSGAELETFSRVATAGTSRVLEEALAAARQVSSHLDQAPIANTHAKFQGVRKSGDPIAFLRNEWGQDIHRVTLEELREADQPLVTAVYRACSKQAIPPKSVLPKSRKKKPTPEEAKLKLARIRSQGAARQQKYRAGRKLPSAKM
jgi:hypothetical protein